MFCQKCGKQLPDGSNFCTGCGNKVIKATAPKPQPVQQPTPQPVQAQQQRPQPVQQPKPQPVQAQQAPKPKKKKKLHGFLKFLLIFTLIIALIFTALVKPAWLPALIKRSKPLPESYKNGSTVQLTVNQDGTSTAGDAETNGYTISVQPNSLLSGTGITMNVLSSAESKEFKDGDYTLLGSPVSLDATNYQGEYFGKDVTLTFAIPYKYQKENVQDWFIAYFNPNTGDVNYFSPDRVDFEKQEIVFTVPHFSEYVPVEVRREEAIEIYCKKYASEQAMGQQDAKELKDLMEPELRNMMEKIGVPKEAVADAVNAVVGGMLSKCKEGKLNDSAGVANNLITACYKYSVNGDYDSFLNALTQTASEEVAKYALEANGVSTSIHPYPAKIAAGLITKSGSIVGSLETGDYKQVAADILEIGVNLEPSTAITNAVANLVVATGQQMKYNFQANEVEKLYQMYRYGTDDFNAGNFDDLWLHVDNDSFFAKQRGAERLLRADYIEAYCASRGWSYSTFSNLPKQYQDEITYAARKQLETYFERRAEADKLTEKSYKDERKFIRGLYGIMDSTTYAEYFGEEDYDPMGRLEKIYEIRGKIEELADPSKKFTKINWSDYVYEWISEGSKGVDEDTLYRNAIRQLKKDGFLKDGIEVPDESELTVEDVCGTWSNVTIRTDNVEVPLIEGLVNTICSALGVSSEGVIEKNESEQSFLFEISSAGGQKLRLTMAPADNPYSYSVYEGTLKKGKATFRLKEDHSQEDGAIQLGFNKFDLEFIKTGKGVRLTGGEKLNTIIAKADIIIQGTK